MADIRVKLCCLRCGHKWMPRRVVVVACPKCKSYSWMKPRRRNANVTAESNPQKLH